MSISSFGLFQNVKPLGIAESVTGRSSGMESSHSLPLLQPSPCECRTCQVAVLTEELLYMRPNLGYVRKGVWLSRFLTNDWTRGKAQDSAAGVLYAVPTVLVLGGLQDSKMGRARTRRRLDSKVGARFCLWVDCVMTAVLFLDVCLSQSTVIIVKTEPRVLTSKFCGTGSATTFRHVPVRICS
jgi:hypothetical protein